MKCENAWKQRVWPVLKRVLVLGARHQAHAHKQMDSSSTSHFPAIRALVSNCHRNVLDQLAGCHRVYARITLSTQSACQLVPLRFKVAEVDVHVEHAFFISAGFQP